MREVRPSLRLARAGELTERESSWLVAIIAGWAEAKVALRYALASGEQERIAQARGRVDGIADALDCTRTPDDVIVLPRQALDTVIAMTERHQN